MTEVEVTAKYEILPYLESSLAKINLRVDDLRKKLRNELFCFSLMHNAVLLLCPFWALLL